VHISGSASVNEYTQLVMEFSVKVMLVWSAGHAKVTDAEAEAQRAVEPPGMVRPE
jgi:hypothetical protein